MLTPFHLLQRVADSDSDVLIEGESDIPYALLVAALVRHGRRAGKPVVTALCGGAQWDVEKALFGRAAGMTDPFPRAGAFEAAWGGTVHLAEVGELPLGAQRTLLLTLATRRIRRIGESQLQTIDVRVIVTSTQPLEDRVKRGFFREDLHRRLAIQRVRFHAMGGPEELEITGAISSRRPLVEPPSSRPMSRRLSPDSSRDSPPRSFNSCSSLY